jgi:hypothetical protein
MGAPILAVLLAATNPAFANVGPADFGAQPAVLILSAQTSATRTDAPVLVRSAATAGNGLDAHIAPADIQAQFEARMLELSG